MKRLFYASAVILVIVLAVGLYKAKTDAAQARADVHALEQRIEDAQADLRALRAEIAQLESPGRVEELAEEHLGLEPAEGAAALPEDAIARNLPAPEAGAAP